MNKNKIEGGAKQAKSSVKDATGKLVGNKKMQVEGKADKTEGKVQKTAGKVEDKVKNG